MKEEKIIRLVAIMLLILQKVKLPTKGEVEEDFQVNFEEVLDANELEYLPKVHTNALCANKNGEKQEDWEIDIVLKNNNVYIPIELKFRHGDQSITGYDKLYEWDIRRISSLVDTYNDIPLGYAIFVTDNTELIKNIKKFNDNWFDLTEEYKVCISMYCNNKSTSSIPFSIDYMISSIEKKFN